MAEDARKLKDGAAKLAAQGKLESAAALYRKILGKQRRDLASRQKLADVLRRKGDLGAAVVEYVEVADGYARDGLLLKAIAVCKVVLELDPGHLDTQRMLADLYARRRQEACASPRRLGTVPEPEPLAVPAGGLDLEVEPVPEAPTAFEVISEAAADARRAGVEADLDIAIDEVVPLPEPPAAPARRVLPRVPLFSDLSPEAFQALTANVRLRGVAAGEVVLRQGDPGDRFYAIASGLMRVERTVPSGCKVVLAFLEDGAFFGEMALLSAEPRSASVVAESDGELIEIAAEVLTAVCRAHPHVAGSLERFYRERLLANALATSPLFRPFTPGNREAVMQRFRTARVAAGQCIITEGQPSPGLFVVLSGAFAVVKGPGGSAAAMLREGDVFGEMSCLRKGPAAATVVARRAGTLLQLPRDRFDELIMTYPQILELVADLADQRQRSLDAAAAAGPGAQVVLV
jgi:CRP-like cAMP-binding protein